MTSPCTSRYRLLVAGRLSTTLTDVMADRFGPTTVVSADTLGTVLEIVADQSALRALLTLLWDLGHDVESLSHQDEHMQSAGP